MIKLTRRQTLAGLGAMAALPATGAFAASPPLPSAPVALNVIDVAGNLALTQPAFEAYAKANPNLVSAITFNKATSPELPGKLQAEQAANRLDIDLVLSGTDALSAGIEQNLWVKLLPDHADALPDLEHLEPTIGNRRVVEKELFALSVVGVRRDEPKPAIP